MAPAGGPLQLSARAASWARARGLGTSARSAGVEECVGSSWPAPTAIALLSLVSSFVAVVGAHAPVTLPPTELTPSILCIFPTRIHCATKLQSLRPPLRQLLCSCPITGPVQGFPVATHTCLLLTLLLLALGGSPLFFPPASFQHFGPHQARQPEAPALAMQEGDIGWSAACRGQSQLANWEAAEERTNAPSRLFGLCAACSVAVRWTQTQTGPILCKQPKAGGSGQVAALRSHMRQGGAPGQPMSCFHCFVAW